MEVVTLDDQGKRYVQCYCSEITIARPTKPATHGNYKYINGI